MNITEVSVELVLKESLFGLLVMSLVVIFNIYSFSWISVSYRRVLKGAIFRGVHFEMLRLSFYVMMLVAVMLFSLMIWVFAFSYFGLVSDWLIGLLFTASFFTSVGNFEVNLPIGWRLIPSIVAFSGLFSFAWATAVTIGMSQRLGQFIDQHHKS